MSKRWLSPLLAVCLLAGGFVTTSVLVEPAISHTPRAEALNAVNILFDRPGDPAIFGPNELVEIFAGNINYLGSAQLWKPTNAVCAQLPGGGGLRTKPGLDDHFQPWADIYIVQAGSSFDNNNKLKDVAGAPNSVAGGLGGSFVFQGLGITKPGGKIGPGTYGIVVDECQNGVWDTGEDSLIDNAFRVELRQNVPPLSTQAVEFQALKASAARLSNGLSALARLDQLIKIQDAYDKASGALQAVMSPAATVSFVFNQAIAPFKEQLPNEVAKKRMRAILTTAVEQHRIRNIRLAADPPQTDYRRFAAPTSAGAGFNESPNGLGTAYAGYIAQQDSLSALTGALLDAIERYQGADEIGDAQWALRHARSIEELAALYLAAEPQAATAATALNAELDRIWSVPAERNLFREANRDFESETGRMLGQNLDIYNYSRNTGYDPDDIKDTLVEIEPLLNRGDLEDTASEWTAIIDEATSGATEFASTASGMSTLAGSLKPPLLLELTETDPDPTIDISVTGTPSAGAVVTVAVTGAPTGATVNWDLDADGEFDDATDATTDWAIPGDLLTGVTKLISVEVTGDDIADSAYELVTIAAGGNQAPLISVHTEAAETIAPGDARTFNVAATDPDGDPLSYEWRVNDETQVGQTGTSFTLTTASDRLDSYFVEALVSDGQALTRTAWFVNTVTPDADNDGFLAAPGPDCDDSTNAVSPADGELNGNGIDDDCDGNIDNAPPGEIHQAATKSAQDGLTKFSSEGDIVSVTPWWGHPRRMSNDEFRYTIQWGDGTSDTATVSGTTHAGTEVTLEHHYLDDGRDFIVESCFEWLDDPIDPNEVFCHDPSSLHSGPWSISIFNDRPLVNAADLRGWGPTDSGPPTVGSQFDGLFLPNDSFGKTMITQNNTNSQSIFPSPDPLNGTGYGRFSVTQELLNANDNDRIGVVFGYDPDFDLDPLANNGPEGELFDPNADMIAVTWSVNLGVRNSAPYCDTSTGQDPAVDAFNLWRRRGQPAYYETWWLTTWDHPGSTDPQCSDGPANGVEVLASVPVVPPYDTTGTLMWRARSFEPNPHPAIKIPGDSYLIEYDYQPDSIRVWIDGVLEIDHVRGATEAVYPPGHAGLFYWSQTAMIQGATASQPTFQFVEGKGGEFGDREANGDLVAMDGITVPMHDGWNDTHEARIDWGDGQPTTAGVVTKNVGMGNGWFDITGEHVYIEAGTYVGEVCATDDEGLSSCFPFTAEVANVAPVVDAGFDIAVAADVNLTDMSIRDAGADDTHTVTVDWGDGTALDLSATVNQFRGGGTIEATHTFAVDGPSTVEVCVADQHGAETCETRELDVRLTDESPVAEVNQGVSESEGSEITLGVGFTDQNIDETHTVTIDWGDGSAPQAAGGLREISGCFDPDPNDTIVEGDCLSTGSAEHSHSYDDDGSYTATVTVCDSAECDTATTAVMIGNVAPELVVSAPVSDGINVSVAGTYTDVGPVDTHQLKVDWGDGQTSDDPVSGGNFATSHQYAVKGDYPIVVCIVDDDGGETCINALGEPDVPFLVPLTPARILDTRPGPGQKTVDNQFAAIGAVTTGNTLELDILGRGGIPTTGVDAIVVNLTVADPTGPGYITAYPCGTRPNASSLNYTTNNIPNEIIAKLSPTGTICLFAETTTHLIADITGYIPTGSDYNPLTPARILDTRPGPGQKTVDNQFAAIGAVTTGNTLELDILGRGGIPTTGVDAIVVNLTVADPTGPGYITAYPCGTRPNASSLNYTTNNIPNEIIAKLSPTGTICLFAETTTHLIADITGYTTP